MEDIIDTVTAVVPHDSAPVCSCDRFAAGNEIIYHKVATSSIKRHPHDLSNVSNECTRFAYLDSFVQALSGSIDELLRILIDTADWVGLIKVSMKSYGKGNKIKLRKQLWSITVPS